MPARANLQCASAHARAIGKNAGGGSDRQGVSDRTKVGDPRARTHDGAVVNRVQWEKIHSLIKKGVDEGATLVTGGLGRPEGLNKGYYVRPTVFADVRNDMAIAREEIFGPVLSIIGYKDEDDAIRLANETPYGLAGFVSSSNRRARQVARQIGRATSASFCSQRAWSTVWLQTIGQRSRVGAVWPRGIP
jgi:acyl-CoA reductase-like NAD-dependent aldehyde dehydrogenase